MRPPLEELLDLWAELPAKDQATALVLIRALHTASEKPSARDTVQIELPRTTASASFERRRTCPDCHREIPKPKDAPWGYCPDCGCLLPVWNWS